MGIRPGPVTFTVKSPDGVAVAFGAVKVCCTGEGTDTGRGATVAVASVVLLTLL